MDIAIPVEAHEAERLKTAFYRFLELRLRSLPSDGEAPQIIVQAGFATIAGAEAVGGADFAREFAAYWKNTAGSGPERDPITRRKRAGWAEAAGAI